MSWGGGGLGRSTKAVCLDGYGGVVVCLIRATEQREGVRGGVKWGDARGGKAGAIARRVTPTRNAFRFSRRARRGRSGFTLACSAEGIVATDTTVYFAATVSIVAVCCRCWYWCFFSWCFCCCCCPLLDTWCVVGDVWAVSRTETPLFFFFFVLSCSCFHAVLVRHSSFLAFVCLSCA